MKDYLYNDCEIVLKQISVGDINNEYYQLYPYFKTENGINPKRVAEKLISFGLAKPLIQEKCELTELGIEIGKGIGFKQYVNNLEKLAEEEFIKNEEKDNLITKIDPLASASIY